MTKSPILGILGGMGPQSTVEFYQRVLEHTDARRDQDHIPTLIWCDTSVPDRTQAILTGDSQPTLDRLIAGARKLEREGCTVLAISCNTAHYFADQVQQHVDIPILHMIRLTADALAQEGKQRPGILATDGTLRTGLYLDQCAQRGLTPLTPGAEGQAALMSLIYDEIKAGRPGSREKFDLAMADLTRQGCDCALLACTELSVFGRQAGLDGFYLDPLDVLARQAVLACGKAPRAV